MSRIHADNQSSWWEITIRFEAKDEEDAHSRHDNAIDALCGCTDDIDASCISFNSSMRPAAVRRSMETIGGYDV
jgi:hypothetical protein|tara:strand:- start:1958 stop:2179 length:222 start_codon:yes stop_codon:yes gene_type:complete